MATPAMRLTASRGLLGGGLTSIVVLAKNESNLESRARLGNEVITQPRGASASAGALLFWNLDKGKPGSRFSRSRPASAPKLELEGSGPTAA